jgi:hypothetical protein
MSRRARLLRKHRRLMRSIVREESIAGRSLRVWRALAARRLSSIMRNVRNQRWGSWR